RIGIEQSHCGVADRVSARGCTGSCIRERELSVLVVGAGGACGDVDFVVVVLAALLVVEAELEGVATLDPSKAVRDGVNRTGRMGRVRTAGEAVQTGDVCRRNTRGDQLAARKDIRIVDAGGCPVEEVGRVYRDVDIVQAEAGQHLVDLIWTD